MKKYIALLYTALIIWTMGSCSKKNDGPDGGNGQNYNYGPGNLFIKQGTEGITKIDMRTGILSGVIGDWHNGSGWDISWGGTKGVKQVNASTYDTRYIIFNTSNGSTVKEIFYEPDDNNGGIPVISPDGTLLALRPTLRDGLVILDMNGKVLREISGYGSTHEFEYLDPVCWEPGGTILFKKDGGLWRTSADFNRAARVRDIPFADWQGHASPSPDGKKIALSLGGHIWLMNVDGSDFHQVTESSSKELSPCFSPDSKYIAVKGNSRAGDPGSSLTANHLCLIPADGQVYRTYPGEDNRVIHPRVKGGVQQPEGLGEAIVGDFIWR